MTKDIERTRSKLRGKNIAGHAKRNTPENINLKNARP